MNDSTETEIERRDKILGVITKATEIFLRGSLNEWQANVFQVLRLLGQSGGMSRIYLCKNEHDDQRTLTGVRYEWLSATDANISDVPALQRIDLELAGFGRWIKLFQNQEIIYSRVSDLPLGERGWFIGNQAKSIIAVPVFVEQSWWGFICLEDYVPDIVCSTAELDAFRTVAVIFGAAIHRKRTEEALERERKSVEQKVRENQDIARFPAEDPSPVLRISKDGVVLYSNRAADPLLQFWNVSLGGRVPEEWQQRMRQLFDSNQVESIDVEYNQQVTALLCAPVIPDAYINVYGRDVTKEREVDRMKSDFIAMASHQLRTPLTAIRWYSDKMLRKSEGLTTQQIEWATAVHDTTVQLADLVNDLLSISRIERGKIDPQPKLNHLAELVQACVKDLQSLADKKEIVITYELPTHLEPFLFDADLIRQVILNVLSNAIKYSHEHGEVHLQIKTDNQRATVSVIDHGIGIPTADQSKICQRFFRAANANNTSLEGTGLGLTFAKMIVDKSGGEFGFTSTENQGSTFWFTLPYQQKGDI